MNEAWIIERMSAVKVVANQMRRRYSVRIDEFDDLVAEGYVALCSLAKQTDGDNPPPAQEVIRRVRNAMSAHMMKLMRKESTSVLSQDFPEEGDSHVEQAINELDLIDRLAVRAYLRGVDLRSIDKELGVSYRRLKSLVTGVFGE